MFDWFLFWGLIPGSLGCMVRLKQLVGLKCHPSLYPSDSSSSSSTESLECIELYWCKMTGCRKDTIFTQL